MARGGVQNKIEAREHVSVVEVNFFGSCYQHVKNNEKNFLGCILSKADLAAEQAKTKTFTIAKLSVDRSGWSLLLVRMISPSDCLLSCFDSSWLEWSKSFLKICFRDG